MKPLTKDILQIIALKISDFDTWYAFALINLDCARVVKEITKMKKNASCSFDSLKFKYFFLMKIDRPYPGPDIFINCIYPPQTLNGRYYQYSSTHGQGNDAHGPKTFSARFTGCIGEGIIFDNGAKQKMTSIMYRDKCVWKYNPACPEHWDGYQPTNSAEAIDRLAAAFFELTNKPVTGLPKEKYIPNYPKHFGKSIE